MKVLMTKCGLAVLPMGWVVAVALAASPGAALAGDDYARVAEASGTTAFLAEVFMPSSGYAIPTSKDDRASSDDYAREADASGTAAFIAEISMPSSGYASPTSNDDLGSDAVQPGAASGEPGEATTESAAALAHQEWVESISRSP